MKTVAVKKGIKEFSYRNIAKRSIEFLKEEKLLKVKNICLFLYNISINNFIKIRLVLYFFRIL